MNKNALNFLKMKADFNDAELFLLGFLTGTENVYINILKNSYPEESDEEIKDVLVKTALDYEASKYLYETVAKQLQIEDEVRSFDLIGFRTEENK